MSDPDMNATVAAFPPERLAREVSFAIAALDQKDPASCLWLASLLERLAEQQSAQPTPLEGVCLQVKQALENPGNDADPEALASVARHLGIAWTPPEV
jgi:hypothetical protein